MKRLFYAVLLLVAAAAALAAAAIDDPQQGQRFDAVVEQLNQDADPNDVIPMLYDYMEYYIWIGYSDPTKADPNGDIERTFGAAYTDYFSRMADRFNDRLGQCDPTVVDEILEFIDFHAEGYSDGRVLSTRETIENSEFWVGYVQWETNESLRDLIDDGDSGDDSGPAVLYTEALKDLRKGNDKQKVQAAKSLGAQRLGKDLTADVLIDLLGDSDSVVRYWAVAMFSKHPGAAQRFVPQLRGTLSDHSWPVRHKAAELLLQLGDSQTRTQAQAVLQSAQAKVQAWPEVPQLR